MATTEPLDDGAAAQWPDPLRISAPAEGSRVRLLRRRLTQWLHGDHLDEDVIEDLVLAASEALENCCDHAFEQSSSFGTMTLSARLADEALVITVADDGCWQQAGTGPTHRGRGLAMIRELVDEVVIETGPDGTHLALTRHLVG
jgi:anti-sigma regulatory factor (Ser/Thr protein kinase)